jgi:hypothetical protein
MKSLETAKKQFHLQSDATLAEQWTSAHGHIHLEPPQCGSSARPPTLAILHLDFPIAFFIVVCHNACSRIGMWVLTMPVWSHAYSFILAASLWRYNLSHP